MIDYEKVRKYTKSDFKKTFRIYKQFCDYLGILNLPFKTIVITGSSGKGTTAQITAEILKSHGYCVGLYTSPHLINVYERILVNSKKINPNKFAIYKHHIIKKLKQFNKLYQSRYEPTFFELLTLISFLFFIEQKIDYAVLEVGIGGRLDAVNITKPVLNFILPVCLEHTDFLGPKETSILKEKQEVIKPKSITITSIKQEKLIKMLNKKCIKMNSTLYSINKDFQVKYRSIEKQKINFDYYVNSHKVSLKLNITSIDIIENCALVLFGLNKIINLNFLLIKKVLLNIHFFGRFQVINKGHQQIILDGAHNYLSINSLVDSLKHYTKNQFKIIFTLMSDKEADLVLSSLAKISDSLILTKINNPREYDFDLLFLKAKKYFKEIFLTDGLISALDLVKSENFILTGSFYLLSEYYKLVKYEI